MSRTLEAHKCVYCRLLMVIEFIEEEGDSRSEERTFRCPRCLEPNYRELTGEVVDVYPSTRT